MHIDVVEGLGQFAQLRDDWDRAYADDPHATIHRSWAWLRGWLETASDKWCILAARPAGNGRRVAFLPLAFDSDTHGRSMYLAGQPHSDNNGFVCVPEHVDQAIPRFAQFVQEKLPWDRLDMRDVSDPRMGVLLDCFSARQFRVQRAIGTPCPVITLPQTWEQYLRDCLSRRTRQNLRRQMRHLEALPDFRTTYLCQRTDDLHIETMLTLWQQRWRRHSRTVARWRNIMRRCAEADLLYVHVFWVGAKPIASKAAYLDDRKKTFSTFMQVYDVQYAQFSPGTAINGVSIRDAIEAGYRVYNFGRGGTEHKYRFGAEDRFNQRGVVVRRSLRASLGALNGRMKRLRRKLVSRTRRWAHGATNGRFGRSFIPRRSIRFEIRAPL